MLQIKCPSCLQKHISLCKSYVREVLDGHSKGGIPDHRDDIAGELANAEYHASTIDKTFTLKLRYFRREMQNKHFIPDGSELNILYILFHYSDTFIADGETVSDEIKEQYEALPMARDLSNVTASIDKGGCGCKNKENKENNK